MGLFDSKNCDICGEKIGLLGNRKVEDGNVCKNCAAKLSPFMSGRRHTTLEDIKRHLEYREQNKQSVAQFNPNMVLGNNTKVYIDQNMGCFAVSRDRDWRSKNPDIIPLNQVSNVHTEVKENKREIYTKDSEGKNVSYNPRQYEYSYEFEVEINVNSPYFDEIKFELSDMSSRPKNTFDMNYQNLQMQANQIQQALMSGMGGGMGMNQMGMNPMAGGMNQMGQMNGMNQMGGMNGQMGMNGMNQMGQMNGMNGMNQMGGMNGMNQMGMNGMNQMGGMNGMNQMGGMNGMNGQMGMNQMSGQMGQMNGMGNLGNMMSGGVGGMVGSVIGEIAGAAANGLAGNSMGPQGSQMGMNQMNGQMGQMNGMNNQMGMNQMNNQMGQMGGMNGMNGQMGQMMGQAPQMQPWTCPFCGTQNEGNTCTGCGQAKG